MVNPVSSSSSTDSTSTPITIGSNSFINLDTVQPWLSISDYLSTLSTAKLNQQQTLYAAVAELQNQDVLQALGQRAAALTQLFQQLETIQATLAGLQAAQITMNNSINTYNTNVQNAANQLNAAITAYNNAPSGNATALANYQAALATYQSQVNSANESYSTTSYSAALATYNSAAASFNAAGVSLFNPAPGAAPSTYSLTSPPAQPPSSTATPPLSTLSIPTLPKVAQLATVPTLAQLTKEYFIPAVSAALQSIQSSQNQIATQSAISALNDIIDATGDITLPAAYIQGVPTAFFNDSSMGSGGGVGIVAASLNSSSPTVSRVVGQGLYTSLITDANNIGAFALQVPTQVLAMTLIDNATHQAAAQVIRQQQTINISGNPQVSGSTVAAQNPVTGTDAITGAAQSAQGMAIAQAFAASIRDMVSGDVVLTAVNAMINAAPETSNLTVAQKQELAASLTATISLGLLNVAQAQLSTSLNSPGLTAQVLGNIAGAPALSSLYASTEAAKINKVLTNPPSILYLKSALAASLAKSSKSSSSSSQAKANSNANRIVNAVAVTGGFNSLKQLHEAFVSAAKRLQIAHADAVKAANAATNFVAQEGSSPNLDTAVNPKAHAALVQALQNGSSAGSLYSAGSSQRVATDQLISANASTNGSVLTAVNSLGANPGTSTNRNFASQVSQHLASAGVSPAQANQISGLAVSLTAPQSNSGASSVGTAAVSPLANAQPSTLLPIPQLAEELSNHIHKHAGKGLDPTRTKALADQTVHTVLSGNSLLAQYNKHTQALKEQDQTNTLKHFYDNAPTLTQPTIALSHITNSVNALVNKLVTQYMDPTTQDSLMRRDQAKQPSNFKRSIDIMI